MAVINPPSGESGLPLLANQSSTYPEENSFGTLLKPQATPSYVKFVVWLAVIVFLLLAQRVFIYTPDDAYITYRYSQNMAEGYGPVFNRNAPLSDRTEGFSCPLFMLLMALMLKLPLGVDLIIRAKLLGIVCGIALLFLAPKLAARMGLPGWAQAALPLLLSVHAVFAISSVDGMETMLAMLWTTLAAYRFLQEWQENDTGKQMAPLSGLLFAACGLTRPEGLLMGLFALGVLLVGRRGHIGRLGLQWIAAFLLPVAAWWTFRMVYFGSFMPNTFYAKQVPIYLALEKGVPYLLRTFFRFVNESPVYAVIGGLWWLLVALGAYRAPFRRTPGILLSLCVLAQILFAVRTGGDWMSSWRYMAPPLVLMMMLSLAGITEMAEGISKTPRMSAAIAAPFCIAMLIVGLWGHKDYVDRPYIGYISWANKNFTGKDRVVLKGWLLEKSVNLSDWLNANLPPGAEIAYSEMGVAPYLSPQLRFLDVRGLTDRGIARLPGTKHEQVGVTDDYTSASTPVGAYLLNERKPDYLIWGIRLEGDQIPSDFQVAIDRLKGQNVLDGAYECIGAFDNPPAPPNCRDVVGVFKRR